MASNTPSRSALRRRDGFATSHRLIRPRLTSRAGSTPSPFQAEGEISPGKNALLHCTAAGSTPPPLDHESFAVPCPLTLVGNASYPVLVHRPAASPHASSPHSVALMQLRFASLAVINSPWDFHPQECAHAGRTKKSPRRVSRARACRFKSLLKWLCQPRERMRTMKASKPSSATCHHRYSSPRKATMLS